VACIAKEAFETIPLDVQHILVYLHFQARGPVTRFVNVVTHCVVMVNACGECVVVNVLS
jgi:hypothetical protein